MDFLSRMKKGYAGLWRTFIKPRRMTYDVNEMLEAFDLEGDLELKLTQFSVTNPCKDSLVCYRYQNKTAPTKKLVIYAHTHSGSSLEGSTLLNILVPQGFDLVCFDFCGNGKSSAQYVTLGYKEKDDLRCVLSHCKDRYSYEDIFLWGRSMGAASILLMLGKYEGLSSSIRGVVLDSPFLNLRKLCVNIGQRKTPFPKFLIEGGLTLVRGTIMDKAMFDIDSIKPVEVAGKIDVPAVFLIANDDELVPPMKLRKMYRKYLCQMKKMVNIKGGHASIRRDSDLKHVLETLVKLSQEKTGEKEEGARSQRTGKHSGLPIKIETKIKSIQSPLAFGSISFAQVESDLEENGLKCCVEKKQIPEAHRVAYERIKAEITPFQMQKESNDQKKMKNNQKENLSPGLTPKKRRQIFDTRSAKTQKNSTSNQKYCDQMLNTSFPTELPLSRDAMPSHKMSGKPEQPKDAENFDEIGEEPLITYEIEKRGHGNSRNSIVLLGVSEFAVEQSSKAFQKQTSQTQNLSFKKESALQSSQIDVAYHSLFREGFESKMNPKGGFKITFH